MGGQTKKYATYKCSAKLAKIRYIARREKIEKEKNEREIRWNEEEWEPDDEWIDRKIKEFTASIITEEISYSVARNKLYLRIIIQESRYNWKSDKISILSPDIT